MTNLAEAPTPTRIVFGTDGWRARVADEFTFDNVRRCADGVAQYVVDRGEQAKGVVVAYDRRFASEHFAQAAFVTDFGQQIRNDDDQPGATGFDGKLVQ